jgi:hypothetical protein
MGLHFRSSCHVFLRVNVHVEVDEARPLAHLKPHYCSFQAEISIDLADTTYVRPGVDHQTIISFLRAPRTFLLRSRADQNYTVFGGRR